MTYYTAFKTAQEAEAAFDAFVVDRNSLMAMAAWENAFSAETHDEYADDLQRWTVALDTAKEYADQGGV